MNKKKAIKKNKKGGAEIPNSVAAAILLAVAAGGYFWINGGFSFGEQDSNRATAQSTTQPQNQSALGTVTTVNEVNGTKHFIHQVPNPTTEGAATLLLPDIKNLSIYRSEQIEKSVQFSNAQQDALIAEQQLKKVEADQRKEMLTGKKDTSNYFGEGVTKPVSVSASSLASDEGAENKMQELISSVQASKTKTPSIMSLVSISRLNGELEAMFNYGGEPVSVGRSGVTYSAALDLPNVSVRSISDQQVCLVMSGKNNCYKVY